MNVTDDCTLAYYCFDDWMFGLGKLMQLKDRDAALNYWLDELGGLAGIW